MIRLGRCMVDFQCENARCWKNIPNNGPNVKPISQLGLGVGVA